MVSFLPASLPEQLFFVEAIRRLDCVTRHYESLAFYSVALASNLAFHYCTRCASDMTGSRTVSSSAAVAVMF